jgi:hypothetical protein
LPIFPKVLSDHSILGISFDPVSTDLLATPSRSPPRIAIL